MAYQTSRLVTLIDENCGVFRNMDLESSGKVDLGPQEMKNGMKDDICW